MKNLFQFLTEAGSSQASAQAKKLNLKSDGHGSWFDARGKLVAVTDKGRLKFTNKKKSAADESPAQIMGQRRRDDNLAGSPLQRIPAPKPKGKAQPERGSSGQYCPDCKVGFYADKNGMKSCQSCGIIVQLQCSCFAANSSQRHERWPPR